MSLSTDVHKPLEAVLISHVDGKKGIENILHSYQKYALKRLPGGLQRRIAMGKVPRKVHHPHLVALGWVDHGNDRNQP